MLTDLLRGPDADSTDLQIHLDFLLQKEAQLMDLDQQISDLVDDDGLENEVDGTLEYNMNISHTVTRGSLSPQAEEERTETPAEARRNANKNILRLQKVRYNKQYEDGMIHKRTKMTMLAALQYPLERESSRRISTRILEDTDTTHLGMDMDMLSSSLTQGWFHVLVGSVSIGFMLLLSGLAVYSNYRMTDVVLSLVVTSQGIYVLLFAMEILIVVYTTGTFALSRDAWQHMDVVLFFLVVAEFVLISLVTPSLTEKVYALYLQVSFIVLLLIRSFKALQKRAVLFVWLWDLLDSVLNHKLFYAYDLSCAYITAEDEAIDKVVRFVQSSNLATKIKGSCSKNKLQTLKNVMDIQQKYPNIEVATKTRQCARRCLNKALDALHELHDGGLLDDKQFTMLLEDMTWRIHAVDGMPTNISVGHPALSIMQSIPWLPRNVVQTLLEVRCFPRHLSERGVLVFAGHQHECISIIISGIVKVSGKGYDNYCNVEGRLENADSNQHFHNEGDFKDYLVSPSALGVIGFLTDTVSVCHAVCETDVELCSIPMEVMQRIVERHPDAPTVIYRMWFSVAVRISLGLLMNDKRYLAFHDSHRKGGVLVFAGHQHECISIIISGIVKVSGKGYDNYCNVEGRLENADSNQHFHNEGDFKDYLVSPSALGVIGFLTDTVSVCHAVCETDVELCSIPMEVMQRIVERHPDAPTVIYRMWFSVAVRISLGLLMNDKRYLDWSFDRLKRFLENGIMPNLQYAIEFALDDAVQDVILIQGTVSSVDGEETYAGPASLPVSLRNMTLPGSPEDRPRPIVLITTPMRYHMPAELDWYHQQLHSYDYISRPKASADVFMRW
ncbi:uncharacterized protein ISCGN_019469 [Ixodes scapularis]